jgi:hypothetical protein
MLEQIRVASPCSANWESMKGDDQVRFCGECKKNVYNLSAMTEREAQSRLAQTNNLCVRFYQRTDGTILTEDCPVGLREKAARIRRRLSFAISGWIGVAAAFAQAPQSPDRLLQIEQGARSEFTGVVTDSTGAVIPGASVTVIDEKSKTFVGRSDQAGVFRFSVPRGIYSIKVEVPGFLTFKKEKISTETKVSLEVRMDTGILMMGAVAATATATVEPVLSPLPTKLK